MFPGRLLVAAVTPRWDQTTLQHSGFRKYNIIIPITQEICETTNFQEAEKAGCQQVLWVFGRDQEITEVGAMNIFVLLR